MTHATKPSRILATVILFCALTGGVSAQDRAADPPHHFWRQSVEQVIVMDADPAPLQAFVGEDFKVSVKDGKAWLLIVLQDSPTNYFDGEEIGPSQDVHIWVRIEGPREGTTTPVIGAPTTFPTMSWFKLFGGTSHPEIPTKFAASGLSYESIENLSLVHSGSDLRGEVVVDQVRSFSWSAEAKAPPAELELIGVNHDFFTRNQAGDPVFSQVQVLVKVLAWTSEGTLDVRGDVIPGGLLPEGTHPVTVNNYDPIWIRVSINVPVPD